MFTATVPRGGGALPDVRGEPELDRLPCRLHDPDLWFADTPAELERAKQLCVGCPLKAQCLASALARHEPWGVWGGEIFEHGAVISRKRPRGRPRKADLERDRAEQDLPKRGRPEREAAA